MSATCSDIAALIRAVWASDEDESWMVRAMRRALSEDVTPRQREYLLACCGEGLTEADAAKRYRVNKSTVCRSLNRGLRRLETYFNRGCRE